MLKQKTTFVVGAGASAEFGLPVGSELAIAISDKLNVLFDEFGREVVHGDRQLFYNVIHERNQELSQYQKAAWVIRDGIILAHSIDDFLDVHQHDQRVVNYGKAAIAKCILEAEAKSKLRIDVNEHAFSQAIGEPTIKFRANADTWLVGLMRLLVRGTPYVDRGKIFDHSTFVVFNYDRCVEHFFVHALQRFYSIGAAEANDIVSNAKIYHPYGFAGDIARVPFGAERANYYEIGREACVKAGIDKVADQLN
jgi:hypothetical protein